MFTKSITSKITKVAVLVILIALLSSCNISFEKEYRESLKTFDFFELKENEITVVPQKSKTFTLDTGLEGDYSFKWYSCDSLMENPQEVSTDAVPELKWEGDEGLLYFYCVVTDSSGKSKTSRVFTVAKTGVPLLVINTEDKSRITEDKDDKKKGDFSLYKADGSKVTKNAESLVLNEIYGHGNSTLIYEKLAFNVKLDKKQALLSYNDLDKDHLKSKKWVLFANYIDKSLMRNYMSSQIATLFAGKDGDWTPQMEFVDLVIDGEYRGQYVLSEKNRMEDDSRLALAKNDIAEKEDLSKGSFVLEIDARADSMYYFNSSISGYVYAMCDPDLEDVEEERAKLIVDYIKEKVTSMEEVIFNSESTEEEIRKIIDVESFVNWYLVNEFMKNRDAGGLSTYIWYDSKAKLFHFGPVWDFDLSSGCDNQAHLVDTSGYQTRNTSIINKLFKFDFFAEEVKEKWNENSEDLYKLITDGIDETYERIRISAELNYLKYKNLGTFFENVTIGSHERKEYKDEVDYLQTWLLDRFNWMEEQAKVNFSLN